MSKMQQIILASRNAGKIAEFKELMAPLTISVLSLLDLPHIPDVIEDGDTFFANARLKAEAVSEATGLPVLADDSGLVVHYLGGSPGVHSARFAHPLVGDAANNAKLLQLLADVPSQQRQAHFTAVLAWARPEQATRFSVGRCFGLITQKPSGDFGFGYDPLFYLPDLKQTMAELEPAIKNSISHRAKAMQQILQWLADAYGKRPLN